MISAYSALDSRAITLPSPPRWARAVANQTVELPEPHSRMVRTDEPEIRSRIHTRVDADIAQSPNSGIGPVMVDDPVVHPSEFLGDTRRALHPDQHLEELLAGHLELICRLLLHAGLARRVRTASPCTRLRMADCAWRRGPDRRPRDWCGHSTWLILVDVRRAQSTTQASPQSHETASAATAAWIENAARPTAATAEIPARINSARLICQLSSLGIGLSRLVTRETYRTVGRVDHDARSRACRILSPTRSVGKRRKPGGADRWAAVRLSGRAVVERSDGLAFDSRKRRPATPTTRIAGCTMCFGSELV